MCYDRLNKHQNVHRLFSSSRSFLTPSNTEWLQHLVTLSQLPVAAGGAQGWKFTSIWASVLLLTSVLVLVLVLALEAPLKRSGSRRRKKDSTTSVGPQMAACKVHLKVPGHFVGADTRSELH